MVIAFMLLNETEKPIFYSGAMDELMGKLYIFNQIYRLSLNDVC